MSGSGAGALELLVDRPLPASLPAGSASAVLCIGSYAAAGQPASELWVSVDGVRHPPTVAGALRPGAPAGHRGFWATVPVRAPDRPGSVGIEVVVRLADGTEAAAPYGEIDIVAPAPPPAPSAEPALAGPPSELIVVCMATFEPDEALFAAQVASLKAQTDTRWICLISDDCSSPGHTALIERVVGGDARFELSRSPSRLGFYRNFERALSLVPRDAGLVALADQDDVWHPDKLAALRAGLGSAVLAYSDQRLVEADGHVLRDTLWVGRRNNATNLASMVVANTITGAACLFRRELLDVALPFPDGPGFQFHDHWLALVALATGDVAYVDRPLYDYVQHAGAIFGDVSSGARAPARRLPRPSRSALRDALTAWRGAYFYGYLSREVQVQTVLARRPPGAPAISATKRRTLTRFAAAQRSPLALAWLAARPARELTGRNETLGSEAALARGIVWKWLVSASARAPQRLGSRLGETGLPPLGAFNQTRLRRWRADITS